ncbi:MAG: AAA family ATPase, partial [Gemmatimonadetes bacterium]|nr:AAA family ATPase [Gemmatimonadota bacterium]
MTSFLARALDGEGGVCFVTGEAGTGKTALLGEFARQGQDLHQDLVLAIGDCNAQTGIGDPYLPFREILGLLTGDVDGQLAQGRITLENANRLRGLLAKSGRALMEHGPDLIDIFVPGGAILTRISARVAERLPWVEGLKKLHAKRGAMGTLPRVSDGTAGMEQHHIFEQFTNVLRSLAREHPLVLVLDDAHWADTASLGLLFHLSRRIKGERILLIGAYRPEDLKIERDGERHPLDPILSEVKRYEGDVWIRVGDQEEGEGRALIDALIDAEPNDLGPAFRQALFEKTRGHALFTVELLEAMKDRGTVTQSREGRWMAEGGVAWDELPARIEGVIEERINRLGDDERELLAVAAVEGEDFTAEVIAGVLGIANKDAVRSLSGPLQTRFEMVNARGIDRRGPRKVSRYAFRHILFQEFLYQTLDPVKRALLHESLAETMEDLFREDLDS